MWKRTSSHNDAKRKYGDVSDTILFYTKSDKYTFQVQYSPYSEEYVKDFYRHVDEDGRRYMIDNLTSPNPRPNLVYEYKGYKSHQFGWKVSREKMEQLDREGRLYFPKNLDGRIRLKRYLDEMPGVPAGNVWDDIQPLHAHARELMGYPTQKPVALLERIVAASSNPGDVVLDPFCGCGTAIAAAQNLGRRWIGIDITHLSIALQKYRLKDMFDLNAGKDYAVIGEPEDFASAQQLAQDDRYQFQWWALSLVKAKPLGGSGDDKQGKKGSDKGIDGVINFLDYESTQGKSTLKRILVQVKSGGVKSGDIRDLVGTLEREKASMGLFITLEPPTTPMKNEALSAGFVTTQTVGKFPRVQIMSIEDWFAGKLPELPSASGTFKQAERVKQSADSDQLPLFGEGE